MDFIIRHINISCNNQRSKIYPQKMKMDHIHCNTVDATQSVRKSVENKRENKERKDNHFLSIIMPSFFIGI